MAFSIVSSSQLSCKTENKSIRIGESLSEISSISASSPSSSIPDGKPSAKILRTTSPAVCTSSANSEEKQDLPNSKTELSSPPVCTSSALQEKKEQKLPAGEQKMRTTVASELRPASPSPSLKTLTRAVDETLDQLIHPASSEKKSKTHAQAKQTEAGASPSSTRIDTFYPSYGNSEKSVRITPPEEKKTKSRDVGTYDCWAFLHYGKCNSKCVHNHRRVPFSDASFPPHLADAQRRILGLEAKLNDGRLHEQQLLSQLANARKIIDGLREANREAAVEEQKKREDLCRRHAKEIFNLKDENDTLKETNEKLSQKILDFKKRYTDFRDEREDSRSAGSKRLRV